MGYRYSGVEYQVQCSCDLAVNPTSRFYAGINMSVGCSMTCPGDRSELCGGPFFMNVYNNTDPNLNVTKDTTNSVYQLTVPYTPLSTNYLGCYTEGQNYYRALTGPSFGSDNMTIESCASYCSGYKYYGLEFASQCYCGNSFANGAKLLDKALQGSSSCDMRCNGDFSTVCGGGSKLSIYNNTAYRPVVIVPNVGRYVTKGCLTDPLINGRALNGAFVSNSSMTVEVCIGFCASKGYKYAG